MSRERLSDRDIQVCFDTVVEEDFFAMMHGWGINRRRIARMFGNDIAERYVKWLA